VTAHTILSTKNLTKEFGGLVAVNNVSLDFERGSLKSIIGPNGSGKTTFFNLLTGVHKPTAGSMLLNDKEIAGLAPHAISQLGISRSYQITNIFPYLTTFENIRLAVQSRGNTQVRYNLTRKASSYSKFHEETFRLSDLIGIDPIRLYAPASLLPHAEQRKLEIAMALATNPKLLLLDEPTAGMSVEEIPEIYEVLLKIKKSYGDNLTMIVIEHKMGIVMKISEEVIVLSQGSLLAKGTPKEIQMNKDVLSAYLGGIHEFT